jgi:hypothetical protein
MAAPGTLFMINHDNVSAPSLLSHCGLYVSTTLSKFIAEISAIAYHKHVIAEWLQGESERCARAPN